RRLQEAFEAFGFGIHVDVDPAGPGADADFHQRDVLVPEAVAPILAVDHGDGLAGKVELPAVEAAAEAVYVTAAPGQPRAAVRAGIVEGADLAWRGAHDDDGIIDDVVGLEVSDVRNVLLAAGHLPDARPQPFVLGRGELGREEVAGRNIVGANLAETAAC